MVGDQSGDRRVLKGNKKILSARKTNATANKLSTRCGLNLKKPMLAGIVPERRIAAWHITPNTNGTALISAKLFAREGLKSITAEPMSRFLPLHRAGGHAADDVALEEQP